MARNSYAGTTSNLQGYLRRKRALISFQIDYEQLTKAALSVDKKRFQRGVFHVQDNVSKELAESARKTMANWLSPDNPRRIGVTGEASRNLKIQKVEAIGAAGKMNEAVWYVVEGTSTKANRYIRMGTRANPSKSRAAQANSNKSRASRKARGQGGREFSGPLHRIAEWARKRGLKPSLTSKPLTVLGKRSMTQQKGIGPYQATQVNIRDSRARRFNKMVWAIWHSMKQHGSSMRYERDFGSKRFDYPNLYAAGPGRNLRTMLLSKFSKQGEWYQNISAVTYSFLRTELTKKGRAFSSRQTRTRES